MESEEERRLKVAQKYSSSTITTVTGAHGQHLVAVSAADGLQSLPVSVSP